MLATTRFAGCESKDIHPCVLETDSCLSHGPNLLVAVSFRAHPTNLVHSEAWSSTCPAEMGIVPGLCWFGLFTLWGEASFLTPDLITSRLQSMTIAFYSVIWQHQKEIVSISFPSSSCRLLSDPLWPPLY